MSPNIFEITKAAGFDAAHHLPDGPPGPYTRLHGHSFRVEATVRGEAQEPVGWVADLGELDRVLREIAGELDHGLLNEKPGLESPTLERLCLYFAERLQPAFPGLTRVVVSRPTVNESCALIVAPMRIANRVRAQHPVIMMGFPETTIPVNVGDEVDHRHIEDELVVSGGRTVPARKKRQVAGAAVGHLDLVISGNTAAGLGNSGGPVIIRSRGAAQDVLAGVMHSIGDAGIVVAVNAPAVEAYLRASGMFKPRTQRVEHALLRLVGDEVAWVQGGTWRLEPGKVWHLGHGRRNDVLVRHPRVSRLHASLRYDAARRAWVILDLGAPYRTFVNGTRIPPGAEVVLADGDLINLGNAATFVLGGPGARRGSREVIKGRVDSSSP